MRFFIFIITLLIIGCWLVISLFLLGSIKIDGIYLALPTSTAAFSDSTGFLNGLFSSFAVVLALVAVLLQGRELKESNIAQKEQAEALKKQLEYQQKTTDAQLQRSQAIADQLAQQQMTNKVMILQAKQQYHSSEISRMDSIISKIQGNKDKSDLFTNCVAKKKEHLSELNNIKADIHELS